MIRVPFSLYLKPTEQRDLMGREAMAQDPSNVPHSASQDGRPARDRSIMRNASDVAKLASRASVQIPDQSISMERLVTHYMGSPLARFHDWFYSQEHDPPKQWSEAYASSIMEDLPPCARIILEQPNDRLLKPYGIEQIVRTMLALGWHPRHIAGLIRSKYERDCGLGSAMAPL